jgi:predicted nucleotidyltransferase
MKDIPPELLSDIVRRLVETLQPLEIYLFGSHASGKPHRHSDVDLLVVVSDDAGDRHALATRGDAALWGLLVPIDIVVFHRREMEEWKPVRHSLPGTVARHGRRLYASST